MKTPYEMLGVAPDADEKAITIAFRKAAKACHPDVNPGNGAAERQFKQLLAARDALKNPEWRALYRYLQFRRRHDRRHWMITIASCTLSALVSAGLVGLLQQPSGSEPLPENRGALPGANPDAGSGPHSFALAGTTADAAGSQYDGLAPALGQAMPAGSNRDANRNRRDPAAPGMALAPAGTSGQAAPQEPIREHSGAAPKDQSATCHQQIGARGAKSRQTATETCSGSPGEFEVRGAPKMQRHATAAQTAPGRPRTLLSLLGRAAGAGAARSKQPSTAPGRFAHQARPPYAPANECWVDEGGARWRPCGASGGE
jgi:curved DNA-binding protein CbpA